MKSNLKNIALLLAFAVVVSCSPKDKELVPVDMADATPGGSPVGPATFDVATQTLVMQGTFKDGGGSYRTSGTAKLYQKDAEFTLVFTDFKTSSGPDLRIYLAEDTKAKNFIEITELKNTGSFFIKLPAATKIENRTQVLIWCKRFTALFGSAEMKVPGSK